MVSLKEIGDVVQLGLKNAQSLVTVADASNENWVKLAVSEGVTSAVAGHPRLIVQKNEHGFGLLVNRDEFNEADSPALNALMGNLAVAMGDLQSAADFVYRISGPDPLLAQSFAAATLSIMGNTFGEGVTYFVEGGKPIEERPVSSAPVDLTRLPASSARH